MGLLLNLLSLAGSLNFERNVVKNFELNAIGIGKKLLTRCSRNLEILVEMKFGSSPTTTLCLLMI